MTIEVVYTHDDQHPPHWRGRTIHPAIPQVVAEGRDLEQARRRMREGLEAAGLRKHELLEWHCVKIGGT